MSANDYVANIKAKNKRLFEAKKLILTPDVLECQLIAAFEAGYAAGEESQSIFDKIFGN